MILRLIAWVLILYLLFKFISNMIRLFIKPRSKNFNPFNTFGGEGETTIRRKSSSSNKTDGDEGEYIDYKEIKD